MSASRASAAVVDDATKVAGIFAEHLPHGSRQPDRRDVAGIAYLVTLTRAAPRRITHGGKHRELAAHVRGLQRLLPSMIAEAETEAASAHAAGRATDMDHFAWRARLLLDAVQPFRGIIAPRNPRGHWHGWARMMRQTVDPIMRQCGVAQPGFGKATSPGILIIGDLLRLAGIDVEGEAIVSALEDRTKGGKLS